MTVGLRDHHGLQRQRGPRPPHRLPHGELPHVKVELADHILATHGRGNAASGNKIPRPTIPADALPSVWADFAARFRRYCSRLEYTTDSVKVHELVECIPGKCYTTLARQYPNKAVYELTFANALAAAKEAVVSRQPRSMIRSQLYKCVQKEGETFASFCACAKGHLIYADDRLHCPHAVPPARRANACKCLNRELPPG